MENGIILTNATALVVLEARIDENAAEEKIDPSPFITQKTSNVVTVFLRKTADCNSYSTLYFIQ